MYLPVGNVCLLQARLPWDCLKNIEVARATGGSYSSPGRPKTFVDREQLEYLRSLRFTWNEISSLLGVSSKTLQRKAKEWDITTYSNISDAKLDEMVQQIQTRFPTSGEVMIRGHLNSQKVAGYSSYIALRQHYIAIATPAICICIYA